MGRNLAVVEVKPCSFSTTQAQEDLRKLAWFCRNADYHRGIFLIYGHPDDGAGLVTRVAEAARREETNADQIRAFHHAAPRMPATRIHWREAKGDEDPSDSTRTR